MGWVCLRTGKKVIVLCLFATNREQFTRICHSLLAHMYEKTNTGKLSSHADKHVVNSSRRNRRFSFLMTVGFSFVDPPMDGDYIDDLMSSEGKHVVVYKIRLWKRLSLRHRVGQWSASQQEFAIPCNLCSCQCPTFAVFAPLLRLSPPPTDKDYYFNLDENEGVCDLFDVPLV